MIETKQKEIRAVLVGLITPQQSEERTKEYLDELAFLADTNHIIPIKRFTQRVETPNTNTYVGEGKLQEIKQWMLEYEEREGHDIDVVIFDDELSPRQLRNIEKELNSMPEDPPQPSLKGREEDPFGQANENKRGKVRPFQKHRLACTIQDRTILILEIFLQRAQTSYAKTQVEMAHLQYMLPRLTRMWTHLDRQRGGGGTNRGTGETQIEADKRIINNRIALLRDQLKDIDKQMATQRQNRGKMVRVALVGYTNVGKSTMMNLLSKSDVFAENKLFATLDTTVRKVTIDNLPFLLSDTVGFIRKLPHNLVESFKSTLDEVREADLLIHVVDISHSNFEEQYEVVEKTINDLIQQQAEQAELKPWEKGAKNQKIGKAAKREKVVPDVPRIVVFNKIDNFRYTPKEEDDLTPMERQNYSLEDLKKTWMAKLGQDEEGRNNCIFISAKNKENIEELRQLMYERIKAIHIKRYPYNDFLFQNYE